MIGRIRGVDRVYKNSLYLFAIKGASFVVPMITLPFLTHTLSLTSFGIYSLLVAAGTYCGTFSDWGFPLTAVRDMAATLGEKDKVMRILWAAINVKLLLSVILFSCLTLFVLAKDGFGRGVAVCALLLYVDVTRALCLTWLAQAHEDVKRQAIYTIVAQVGAMPLFFILVRGPNDVWQGVIPMAVASTVTMWLSLGHIFRRGYLGAYRFCITDMLSSIRASFHAFVAQSAIILFTRINVMVLSASSGVGEAAIYSAADRLRAAANSLPEQVANAFFPRVSRLFQEDQERAVKLFKRCVLLMFVIGMLSLLSILMAGWWFIPLLLGPKYSGTVTVLVAMLISHIFGNIAYPLGVQIFLNKNMGNLRTVCMVTVGVLNIPFCYVLSAQWGALGAAVALIACEVVILLWFGVLLHRDGRRRAGAQGNEGRQGISLNNDQASTEGSLLAGKLSGAEASK